MKQFLIAPVSALTLLLLAGAGARAGTLDPSTLEWTYTFSAEDVAVYTDSLKTAGVSFTDQQTKSAKGSSDIVATNLSILSSADPSSPDKFSSTGGTYKLTLVIANTSEPFSAANPEGGATFTFTGKLGGSMSASNANVTNAFDGGVPLSTPGPLLTGSSPVQGADLGSYHFAVQLVAYTPPGPPDQARVGGISAHVTVTSLDTQVVNSPEPSTLLLSSLGLTFLGGAAWRKRRARLAAA